MRGAPAGPDRDQSIATVYSPDVYVGEPGSAYQGYDGMNQAISGLQARSGHHDHPGRADPGCPRPRHLQLGPRRTGTPADRLRARRVLMRDNLIVRLVVSLVLQGILVLSRPGA